MKKVYFFTKFAALLVSIIFLSCITNVYATISSNEQDKIPPVFISWASNEIIQGLNFDPISNIWAFDNLDGNITKNIVITLPDMDAATIANTPGNYIIHYSVSDSSGNTSTLIRSLTVKAPKISKIKFEGYQYLQTGYYYRSDEASIITQINSKDEFVEYGNTIGLFSEFENKFPFVKDDNFYIDKSIIAIIKEEPTSEYKYKVLNVVKYNGQLTINIQRYVPTGFTVLAASCPNKIFVNVNKQDITEINKIKYNFIDKICTSLEDYNDINQ